MNFHCFEEKKKKNVNGECSEIDDGDKVNQRKYNNRMVDGP